MPNHVTNILSGPKEILDSLAGENGPVDFETVIPSPQEVKDSPRLLSFDYQGPNWYSWNIGNWGTKWNAYAVERIDDETIRFETAWSHPRPVIEALSKQHPDVYFRVKYADEDLGSNLGDYTIRDAVIMIERVFGDYNDPETRDFAAQLVHGQTYAEYTADWD